MFSNIDRTEPFPDDQEDFTAEDALDYAMEMPEEWQEYSAGFFNYRAVLEDMESTPPEEWTAQEIDQYLIQRLKTFADGQYNWPCFAKHYTYIRDHL